MRRPTIELDWEVWALPLCVAVGFGQVLIRIGPVCIAWWGKEVEELNERLDDLDRRIAENLKTASPRNAAQLKSPVVL